MQLEAYHQLFQLLCKSVVLCSWKHIISYFSCLQNSCSVQLEAYHQLFQLLAKQLFCAVGSTSSVISVASKTVVLCSWKHIISYFSCLQDSCSVQLEAYHQLFQLLAKQLFCAVGSISSVVSVALHCLVTKWRPAFLLVTPLDQQEQRTYPSKESFKICSYFRGFKRVFNSVFLIRQLFRIFMLRAHQSYQNCAFKS